MRLRLYFDHFGQVLVPSPPITEQEAIVKQLEESFMKIDTAIKQANKSIDKLKEYKATLINSAVTGKIKVS